MTCPVWRDRLSPSAASSRARWWSPCSQANVPVIASVARALRRRRRIAQRQRAFAPGPPLAQVAAGNPEPRQLFDQALGRRRVAPLDRPGQDRAQVVVLGLQPFHPPPLHRGEERLLDAFQQTPAPAGQPLHRRIGFAGRRQLLQPELPDRLQHPKPRFAIRRRHLLHQTLVDEGGDAVEHGGVSSQRMPRASDAHRLTPAVRRRLPPPPA